MNWFRSHRAFPWGNYLVWIHIIILHLDATFTHPGCKQSTFRLSRRHPFIDDSITRPLPRSFRSLPMPHDFDENGQAGDDQDDGRRYHRDLFCISACFGLTESGVLATTYLVNCAPCSPTIGAYGHVELLPDTQQLAVSRLLKSTHTPFWS